MKNFRKQPIFFVFLALLGISIFIWVLVFQSEAHKYLKFAALDIGQGDALFIESPSGVQVLFDGGPSKKILGVLPKVMPFYDRKIDAIIITNPDADHIAGFLDILKNYKVNLVVEPGTWNDSKTYKNLEAEIKRQNIPDILARKGMKIDLGGGVVIDILFPDQDVSSWTTNDGSIVARLSYGKNSVMLTGDATKITEGIVLAENPAENLKSDILKVGHHGSKTSSSPEFVSAVSPTYAVISDGKNNKYGHPHQETLNTLSKFGAKIFRTDLLGTIIFKSNGEEFSI
jgi:competence protein ComEC